MGRESRRRRRRNARRIATDNSVAGLRTGEWDRGPGGDAFPCCPFRHCTVAEVAACLAYRCGGSAGMTAHRIARAVSPASRFNPWTGVRRSP